MKSGRVGRIGFVEDFLAVGVPWSKCMKHTPVPTTSHHSTSTPFLGYRTTAREFANPVDYKHPYVSMAQFADLLALRYDANRTRHAYYRHVRLLLAHFKTDPASLSFAGLVQPGVQLRAALRVAALHPSVLGGIISSLQSQGGPSWQHRDESSWSVNARPSKLRLSWP